MPSCLPFVLSIPHAGLATPPELAGRVVLDEVDLYNECDLWADQLFDFSQSGGEGPPARPGDPSVLATVTTPFARTLIDVNRSPDLMDDPDGIVKTQTSYGVKVYANSPALPEREALRDRYWLDFHRRLEAALNEHRDHVRLLLDCHNMAQVGPSHYAFAGQPRPLICLANLGDASGESLNGHPVTCPGWLLRRAGDAASELFSDMALLEPTHEPAPVVALNYPFAGGYIIRRHCQLTTPDGESGAPLAIMIEVNRGLFVGNQSPRTPVEPANVKRINMVRDRLRCWAEEVATILMEV